MGVRWVFGVVVLAGTAWGAEPEGYVYTNADIEALPPLDVQAVPIAEFEGGWEFVEEFLARHDARLDADREHALGRQLVESETERVERRHDGYGLALAPGYYYDHHRDKPRHERIHDALSTDYANRIVPLHARPSQADLMRFDAYRRSGADAIPRRGVQPQPSPHRAPAPGPRRATAHVAGTAINGAKRGR